MIENESLWFVSPGEVEIRQEKLPEPQAGQVLVRTRLSGVSAGSEMLIYRGQFPDDLTLDENIPALAGKFGYPVQYGYACVGEVVQLGTQVDPDWQGKTVFAFQPHRHYFLSTTSDLLPLPDDLAIEDALFLPNMETAVTLVQDGNPRIDEDVIVFGQGVVGLLVTALLAAFPLHRLVTLDNFPARRMESLEMGASASLDPVAPDCAERVKSLLPSGVDLAFELSGSPAALNQAIATTRFSGRVVIGSWYGQKHTDLALGGRFHRSRIQLISSQVSTIAPELSGRWDKSRRFATAWDFIRRVRPSRYITHCIPFSQAAQAYHLLDRSPGEALQVVFTYDTSDTRKTQEKG
jgi:2-desacetyl-2-hydroxyethyl bacteriochlorophyllide A dehydrogenase